MGVADWSLALRRHVLEQVERSLTVEVVGPGLRGGTFGIYPLGSKRLWIIVILSRGSYRKDEIARDREQDHGCSNSVDGT